MYNVFDWYWLVGDTNPTTQVYSSKSNAYVANTSAQYLAWLLDPNVGGASGSGSAFSITNAVSGTGGKIRLTIFPSTSTMQTNQQWNVSSVLGTVEANGNWLITIIDSTHIELQGSTFVNPYNAGGLLTGATEIDTDAHLRRVINTAAAETITQTGSNAASTQTSGVDITLTNPPPLYIGVSMTANGKKLILPPMNAPQSLAKGQVMVVENTGSFDFTITAQDGTTVICKLQKGINSTTGEKTLLFLFDNSTLNGGIKPISVPYGNQVPKIVDILGNTIAGIQFTFTIAGQILVDPGGQGRIPNPTPFAASTFTVDITTAGPVANGRDRAAAFGASTTVSFFAIWGFGVATAGLVSASPTSPTLPTGYTHFAYLCSATLDGAVHLPAVHLVKDWMSLDTALTVLSNGAATVDTQVVLSLPIVAVSFRIMATSWGVTADGTGAAISVLHLGYLSGVDMLQLVSDFVVSPTTATRIPSGEIEMPALGLGGSFFYHQQVLNGSAPATTIVLTGWREPNGA